MKLKATLWSSLLLLLISYAGFGWYLSGITTHPAWARSACYQIFGPAEATTIAPEAAPRPAIAAEEPIALPRSPQPEPTQRESSPAAPRPEAKTLKNNHPCRLIIDHNLLIALGAVLWVLMSATAFISPLQSFNRFVTRWFRSDTVAFGTIFIIASMAAIILFWLHVFLQILTILAADVLARIDIQVAGLSGMQAFWILVSVSLTGLSLGWLANGVL